MRKKILTLSRRLLCAAFLSITVLSCENERPQFFFPEPEPEESDLLFLQSLTPDTIKFRMRDSITFSLRTIPFDLLGRDSVGIQVNDTSGAPYRYISINAPRLGADSVWSITGYLSKGISNGDIVTLAVAVGDTVLISDPAVLSMLPKEPIHLTTLTSDTLTFDEGQPATIRFRTTPFNLAASNGICVELADTSGQKYPYADISSLTLTDSIWNMQTIFRYGMKSGDMVCVKISDTIEDVSATGRPIMLDMIPIPVPTTYSLTLVSDSISAYTQDNTTANVRFKTAPWNVLLDDTAFHITLADTVSGTVSMGKMEFQPKDSCWKMEISILQPKTTDIFASIMMTGPDTVVTSRKVIFKKVAFGLQSVTANGYGASINQTTFSGTIIIPTLTDFARVKFIVKGHTGDKAYCDSMEVIKGRTYTIDCSKPLKITICKYDLRKEYTIKVANTGLPIVNINTNGQTVTRRDTWVPKIAMTIHMPDGTLDYQGTLSIKGRGNQTWSDFNKKPYALKLDQKANILGMHKDKRWVLLANVKDRTLLRNDVCLWISKQTDMPYTVNGQFVELVWNGKHMGNYYLCEQIKIDNNRIDIHEPNLTTPANGGYLMNIDALYNYKNSSKNNNKEKWADKSDQLGFWTTRYKMPYIFKDPEEDEFGNLLSTTSTAFTYIRDYVASMETAINNAANSNDWQNWLDMERAIDFALIQEMTMNHDAYNNWPEDGPHSTYVYKDSCGKLCFGPVWDFDYHTFTLYNDFESGSSSNRYAENQRIYNWEILKLGNKSGIYYFSNLRKNPQFKSRLIQKWNIYKVRWQNGFEEYVDEVAEKNRVSESINKTLWGYPSKQNGDWDLTYDAAVKALKEAFRKRLDWIDKNISNL